MIHDSSLFLQILLELLQKKRKELIDCSTHINELKRSIDAVQHLFMSPLFASISPRPPPVPWAGQDEGVRETGARQVDYRRWSTDY